MRSPKQSPPSPQSGNILFYILICVAIFGALGFAMAHMMRGGNGPPGELRTVTASGILQYADTVKNAVNTMQVDGVDAANICFDSPGWGNTAYTFAACNTIADKVFDINGGGVTWELTSGDATGGSAWLFTGANGVDGVGTTCAAASCADLKMVLTNIPRDTCIAINNQLGVTNPNGVPPIDTGFDLTAFAGAYSATATNDIGDEPGSSALAGKLSGCFEASTTPSAGSYDFYRVLIAR